MAWPDDLYEASYRGVAFEVELADSEFSQRHQVHEFPGRDFAVVEEFGEAPTRIRLQAFVAGPDAQTRKLALIRQCTRRSGGGTLVHPHYGSLPVFCTRCVVSESTREGDLVRFDLEFLRVEGTAPVVDRRPPIAGAQEQTAVVQEAAAVETTASLQVTGVPEFARTSVADQLRALGLRLRQLDVFRGPAEEAAILGEEIARLVDEASSLVTSPASAANSILQTLQRVSAAAANAQASLAAYEALADFDARLLGGSTALEQLRDANVSQIASQIRQTAVAGAVAAAAAINWASLDDALAARDRLAALLDAELDRAAPAQYEQLALLRAALVAAVPPPERSLPRIQRLTMPAPIGALELAYQLYDDADRALELIERNRFQHAGRIPALSTVEALSL